MWATSTGVLHQERSATDPVPQPHILPASLSTTAPAYLLAGTCYLRHGHTSTDNNAPKDTTSSQFPTVCREETPRPHVHLCTANYITGLTLRTCHVA